MELAKRLSQAHSRASDVFFHRKKVHSRVDTQVWRGEVCLQRMSQNPFRAPLSFPRSAFQAQSVTKEMLLLILEV